MSRQRHDRIASSAQPTLALGVGGLLLTVAAMAGPRQDPPPDEAATPAPAILTLYHSEAAPNPEAPNSRGMIGHIERIFAGTEDAPLEAVFRVSMTGQIHESDDGPWTVTLTLGQPQKHIGNQIREKENLESEAAFVLGQLQRFRYQLSEAHVQTLKRGERVTILVEGPMDALDKWLGPASVELVIGTGRPREDPIRNIRFVRQVDEFFNPIRTVLLHEVFYVEVRFENEPQEPEKTVDLTAGTSDPQSITVTRTNRDRKVYRSGPLFLIEAASEAD